MNAIANKEKIKWIQAGAPEGEEPFEIDDEPAAGPTFVTVEAVSNPDPGCETLNEKSGLQVSKMDFRWLLNCARSAVRDTYEEGSRRWKEMDALVDTLAEETGVFDEEDGNFEEEFITVKETTP